MWGCLVNANLGNDKIRLLWCQQHISSENIQTFVICMSTFIKTLLLISWVIASVFPLLYDEWGGPPQCFSKPFCTKYARMATSWVFLAINMFTLVAVHLFPFYFPGNKLKHPSKCTILKVIKKIDLCSHAPWRTQCMCINVFVDTLGIYNMDYTRAKVILVFHVQDNMLMKTNVYLNGHIKIFW